MGNRHSWAFIVGLIVVVQSCGQSAPVAPTPSLPPTPSPVSTATPVGATGMQYTLSKAMIWERQLREAGLWDVDGLTMTSVNEVANRITIGVDCESNRDRFQHDVQNLLVRVNIPTDVVEIKVQRLPSKGDPPKFKCAPPEVVDPASGRSSPGFGGLFMEAGLIKVYMLNPTPAKAEELALTVIGRETLVRHRGVRALEGQYTWAQLLEWYQAVRDTDFV